MNTSSREPGLFLPALWRLSLAGGLFILVYSFCNQFTATRGDVPTLMFEWERHIPFVRELVVPYWSLDLFFCGAFFLCGSRLELSLLTKRLILVTLASGFFFLLFPLKLGLPRPEPAGWTAPLFEALYSNDQPYNLAPSLHISLRSLVWVFYGAHLRGLPRRLTKVWFMLIGASTLLVWQHHLVDVAGGFVMAWIVAALVPDPRQPGTHNPSSKMACRYGAAALAFAGPGLACWVFFWPCLACGIFSLAYATGRSRLLGKENGTLSPAAEWCLLPVLIAARWYQRRWLNRIPGWHEVCKGVMFGRRLTTRESRLLCRQGPLAVVDLTAESTAPAPFREEAVYHNLPLLDLVPLKEAQIRQALDLIHHERASGRRVYLHCQLGLQRSAQIAARWLVQAGEARNFNEARTIICKVEPLAILNPFPDAPEIQRAQATK